MDCHIADRFHQALSTPYVLPYARDANNHRRDMPNNLKTVLFYPVSFVKARRIVGSILRVLCVGKDFDSYAVPMLVALLPILPGPLTNPFRLLPTLSSPLLAVPKVRSIFLYFLRCRVRNLPIGFQSP